MDSSPPGSPDEDFFNDLSRQPGEETQGRRSSGTNANPTSATAEGDDNSVPRTKRIACIVCRKRKLKCDGTKPKCSTCARLGHHCTYDEARKKSGPKRGYVKHLEARLAQVETLLNTTQSAEPTDRPSNIPQPNFLDFGTNTLGDVGASSAQFLPDISLQGVTMDGIVNDPTFPAEEPLSWEVIGLGLDEPLPSQDVIDELHDTFFAKIHSTVPILHRPRYLNAMHLAPNMRPPICLRYVVWALAAFATPKYTGLAPYFYARARKYIERDELKGYGENMISVAHCQCWSMLASYEFKLMFFPRAWMSVGRAGRLALMMSLNSQDRQAIDVKVALPPPRDWIEREERRRTFWLAFCQDRYASVGTGWPMLLDERDVATNLPSTEQAYLNGTEEKTLPLTDALTPQGASTLSPFAGVILMAYLFGRNLNHVHRPEVEDTENDINSAFWKRHRMLDNILLNTSLSLPDQLRLPAGLTDPNVIFVNMTIHSATICLHQAAIFKADKAQITSQISMESKRRCMIAADQIANIMRLISHVDLTTLNPFISFCLYVSARVFVQYLKVNKNDANIISSLQFLLAAMQAFKVKSPLTESFLVQLDVDLEGSGLEMPNPVTGQPPVPLRASGVSNICPDQADCIYILKMRTAQDDRQGNSPLSPPGFTVPSGKQSGFEATASTDLDRDFSNLPDRSRDSPFPAADPTLGNVSAPFADGFIPMETDVYADNQAARGPSSLSNSGQPTPSASSNNASSSYSPAGFEDHSLGSSTSPGVGYTSNNTFANRGAFSTFTPGSTSTPGSDPAATLGASNPFALHGSWRHFENLQNPINPESTGLTPGPDLNSWPGVDPGQAANTNQENEWAFQQWNGSGGDMT